MEHSFFLRGNDTRQKSLDQRAGVQLRTCFFDEQTGTQKVRKCKWYICCYSLSLVLVILCSGILICMSQCRCKNVCRLHNKVLTIDKKKLLVAILTCVRTYAVHIRGQALTGQWAWYKDQGILIAHIMFACCHYWFYNQVNCKHQSIGMRIIPSQQIEI